MMRRAGAAGLCVVLLSLAPGAAPAAGDDRERNRPPVSYRISFENAAHHEARIVARFRDVPRGALELRMSRASPGRYAIHEFAKNVYDFAAVDGAGRPLKVDRKDPYSWFVDGHDGTVVATYTLFADRADGTYSQIDETHAHLNMPATFLWAKGLDARSVEATFVSPNPAWTIATQLQPTDDPATFRAPDLQYFLDSPTELAPFEWREWRVAHEDEEALIRLAVHHAGDGATVDAYAAKAKNVVAAQIALFEDLPDFDYGTYTFITDSIPQASGDGMEHRNSTIITDAEGLAESNFEQLGTLSHEFFHAWNVERLRPDELEPFDFTRANPSPNLWFAEGFTSYYGPLLVLRGGESTTREFAAQLSRLLNTVLRGTGRRFHGPREMSLRAPFTDAASAIDPTNNANVFVSYYPYGATVALGLDLELRRRYAGTSLDDMMRRLWRSHGAPEKPYTENDLVQALAAISNDAAFAEDVFRRWIEGSELPDFGPLLAQAGFVLKRANPGAASLGRASFKSEDGRLLIDGATRIGEPLYEAGLDRGDEIIAVDGAAMDDADDFGRAVAKRKPGERGKIRFRSRGGVTEREIVFIEDGALEVVMLEDRGGALTEAQRAFREAWLGPER